MKRYLLLILLSLLGSLYGAEGGAGGGNTSSGGKPWDGQGTYPGSSAISLPGFTNLNGLPQTYVCATSKYDPTNNVITAPGVLRTRLVAVGGKTFNAALIEGPRTNLLAAGSSDHPSKWNAAATDGVLAGPSGEMIIGSYKEASATQFWFISQNVTVAASALPYSWTFFIQNLPGSLVTTKLVQLDDGSGSNGVRMTVDIGAGTVTSAAAAFGAGWTAPSGSLKPWGTGYLCTLIGTNNSVTTLRPVVFTTGTGSSHAGDSVTGFYFGMTDLQQAAFPSSFISNRNLLTYSNVFSNAIWTKNASLTVAQTGGLMPSGETGWTVTTATGSDSLIYNLTVTASTNYVASWQAKLGTTAAVRYTIWDTTHSAYITLPTNYAGSLNSSTYTKVSFSFTTPAGCTAIQVIPITWTGVAGTALCGDVQTEYGTTPTAYWGTNATVGGRDADNLSVSLAGITDTRTNLLKYSEQFDNAAWLLSNATVVANNATDPNGNSYADTVTATTTAGIIYQILTVSPSTQYTFIWQAKLGTLVGPSYTIYDVTHSANIANATYAATGAWGRFAVTFTTPAGCTSINVQPMASSTSAGTIILFGAQVVQGTDPGAAAYLPTAGTAVTATQTGLSTTTGTIVALGVPYGRGTSAVSAKLYQTSASSGSSALFDPTGSSYRDIYSPFSSQAETNGALSVYASTWNPSVDLTYAGGAQIATVPTTATTAPYTLATSMAVGSGIAVAAQYYGWVWLGYWHNRALKPAQIRTLYQTSKLRQ